MKTVRHMKRQLYYCQWRVAHPLSVQYDQLAPVLSCHVDIRQQKAVALRAARGARHKHWLCCEPSAAKGVCVPLTRLNVHTLYAICEARCCVYKTGGVGIASRLASVPRVYVLNVGIVHVAVYTAGVSRAANTARCIAVCGLQQPSTGTITETQCTPAM
jgi:hypothetical protein